MTEQQLADELIAGFRAAKAGEGFQPFSSQGWRDGYLTFRPTAAESVNRITSSPAFTAAAREFHSQVPEADPDKRVENLRGLRVFTEAQIADRSSAGHAVIRDELHRIFAQIERWRIDNAFTYSKPERQFILGLLQHEEILVDLAEVVEAV